MNALKKVSKNSICIIVIFSITIFTFSICTSIIDNKIRSVKEKNGLIKGETSIFNFKSPEVIDSSSIIDLVKNQENVYLEYNPIPLYDSSTTWFGKGIYFDYLIKDIPPLLNGRFINTEDTCNGNPVIVIGKDLKYLTETINGKESIKINNVYFEVIGIIGYENKKSAYDSQFILNLSSIKVISDSRAVWKLVSLDNDKLIKEISKYAKDLDTDIEDRTQYYSDYYDVNFSEILSEVKIYLDILLLAIIIGVLNIVQLITLWSEENKKEIGIRKAVGSTTFKIIMFVSLKFQKLVMISMILGIGLHYILKNILNTQFKWVSFDLSLFNILIITLISSLIGIIASVGPVYKANKLQINEVMKGR